MSSPAVELIANTENNQPGEGSENQSNARKSRDYVRDDLYVMSRVRWDQY